MQARRLVHRHGAVLIAAALLLGFACAHAADRPAGGSLTPRLDGTPDENATDERIQQQIRKIGGPDSRRFNPKLFPYDAIGKPAKAEIPKNLEGEVDTPDEEELPSCVDNKRMVAAAGVRYALDHIQPRQLTVAELVSLGYLSAVPVCLEKRRPGRYTIRFAMTGAGIIAVRARCTRHLKLVQQVVDRSREITRCAANRAAIHAAALKYAASEKNAAKAPDLVDLVTLGFLASDHCTCPLKGHYSLVVTNLQSKVPKAVVRCSFCGGGK